MNCQQAGECPDCQAEGSEGKAGEIHLPCAYEHSLRKHYRIKDKLQHNQYSQYLFYPSIGNLFDNCIYEKGNIVQEAVKRNGFLTNR